jgi:hypothetical protein
MKSECRRGAVKMSEIQQIPIQEGSLSLGQDGLWKANTYSKSISNWGIINHKALV